LGLIESSSPLPSRFSSERVFLEGSEQLSWLFNDEGKPRIYKLRDHYRKNPIDHEELIKAFRTYYEFNEYAIIEKRIYDISTSELVDSKKIAVKTIKRGNDKWKKRVRKKIYSLTKLVEEDFSKHHDRTNWLFITYTVDPKIYNKEQAWEIIPKNFNKEITNLRNKFGKIDYVHSVEAQANGYPHIHALVRFNDISFEKFYHYKSRTYRLRDWKEINRIKVCWKMGFVDVQAVYSKKEALSYLGKMFSYLLKDVERTIEKAKKKLKGKQLDQLVNELAKAEKKAILGLAFASLFNKHSFNFSRAFLKLSRLDIAKSFSNSETGDPVLKNPKFLVITRRTKRDLLNSIGKWVVVDKGTGNYHIYVENRPKTIEQYAYLITFSFVGLVDEHELSSLRETVAVA
jgi:hypothetical protein